MNQYPVFPGQDTLSRQTLRLPIATKNVTTELNHDFTLPDYLPEIRKLLRVTATPLSDESYVGAASAEFSGDVKYHLLYVGADGALWSAEFSAPYEISLPFTLSDRCDPSLGIDAFESTSPELLVTRVTSPRKINVRCKLVSTAEIYAESSLEEKLHGHAGGDLERLHDEADCAVILHGKSKGISLSDEILQDGQDNRNLRVISSEGQVFVSEATSEQDYTHLRGEVVLKLLVMHEDTTAEESPSVLLRKVPFDATVETPGSDRYFEARGFGEAETIHTSVEDGRILCDVTLSLTAECQKNRRFVYTEDLFSTRTETDTVYETIRFPLARKCGIGNFTFSESTPLEGLNLSAEDKILDVTGSFSKSEVTLKNDRLLCTGEGDFHLLVRNDRSGEYSTLEVTLPFRYLTECNTDLPVLSDEINTHNLRVLPITLRGKTDGERLAVEGELAVSLRVSLAQEKTILTEAVIGSPYPSTKGMLRIYYPKDNETLWNAARRYHVSPKALAVSNGISLSPKDPLDDIRFLTISET